MNAAHLEDVLPIYFSRLFPFEDLYEWLKYGEANTFACREFVFNFEGDRYLRYQAYSSLNDLKNDVKRKKPYKIDIGAVYNNPPSNYMREAEFYPVQKELIFDLDLTDYDEIRTCCSGTNVCSKCWKFMIIAIKILDTSLREQNMLGTQEGIDKFLGIIDEALRTDVQHLLDKYQTSASRWQAFVEYFRNQIESKVDMWSKTPFLIEEIMIQYAYPRLDINVSLGISHLLKSPFSVHPRTGKIGIILDPKTIEHFDPCEVPTVTQLFKEIDVYDSTSVKQDIAVQNNQEKITDIMKTSLNTSLKLFRVFLSDLKKSQSMSNDT
ncbi:DNA primase small subunit isoform X2 [Nasonia vitripennis]|uniref:DNA primase n=1 Tax=Nasonia vitripennis TaxID=7425 RepID=A0A7M7QIY3_NASVI|nr:DNA primase small subunit isoform X2 [Nasonia vitripennis]